MSDRCSSHLPTKGSPFATLVARFSTICFQSHAVEGYLVQYRCIHDKILAKEIGLSDEVGVWRKAKKKTQNGPSEDRTEPSTPSRNTKGPLTIDQTRAYELEWCDLREIIDELRGLLPKQHATKLPEMPVACPPWRWKYDVGGLLESLKLPDFDKQDSTYFTKNFAKGVANQQYVLVCLKALLENGIGPPGRESDIDCALWMLQNPLDLKGGWDRARTPVSIERPIVSAELLAEWTASHGADIERRVASYTKSMTGNSWSTRGLLRHLGYRVGMQGEPQAERHEILTGAVLLPARLLPQQHRGNWGEAGTRTRLGEIRRMITLFLNLAQGKSSANMGKAKREWQADLDWLARKYQG